MNIEFKPFDTFYDEYDFESNPHLLLIINNVFTLNNEIKEVSYEFGRNQFYIYSGLYDETGTKYDYISEDDSRITHWAYTKVQND